MKKRELERQEREALKEAEAQAKFEAWKAERAFRAKPVPKSATPGYQPPNLRFPCRGGTPRGGQCTQAGKYSSRTGATECSKCQAGTHSSAGAATCSECPAGTYAWHRQQCDECPIGSYCEGGVKKPCESATYSGATTCNE